MKPCRLEIIGDWPRVFAQAADDDEKCVEDGQRDSASSPAAEEFSEQHIPTTDWLGEKGKDGAVFAFGGDLARGRADGDDERGNPDKEQTNFFQIANDRLVVEEVCGAERDG